MKKATFTLIITGVMMVLTGCAGNGQLSNSSPNNGYYTPSSNTHYDAYPHKDRYDPTSKPFLSNNEGKIIENPNYIPQNFPR